MSQSALQRRIKKELAKMQQAVERAQKVIPKLQAIEDEDILEAFISDSALNMQSFYTGAESILYAIARDIDQSVPSGESWHQQLVEQMSVEIPTVREAVLSTETAEWLDEFRRFRHVVRSMYAFDLDEERVLQLVAKLLLCYQAFAQDVWQFLARHPS
ncbi:MAG: hypothetical protein AAFQ61_01405 [Cyanobacteria bacterium J06626_23]